MPREKASQRRRLQSHVEFLVCRAVFAPTGQNIPAQGKFRPGGTQPWVWSEREIPP